MTGAQTREENAAELARDAEVRVVLGHEFRPMTDADYLGFAGVESGSLVCWLENSTLILAPSGELAEIDEEGRETIWIRRDR